MLHSAVQLQIAVTPLAPTSLVFLFVRDIGVTLVSCLLGFLLEERIIPSLCSDFHQNIPAPEPPLLSNEMELPSPFPSRSIQHDCRECSQRYTPIVAFCVSVFPLRTEDAR